MNRHLTEEGRQKEKHRGQKTHVSTFIRPFISAWIYIEPPDNTDYRLKD